MSAPSGGRLVETGAPPCKMPREDFLALAQQIEEADSYVKSNAISQLRVISAQMSALRAQAERIVRETALSHRLHHKVECRFKKVPGRTYYLYERDNGKQYFSMIGPEEWGDGSSVSTFLGAYRLESDMSWTPEEQAKIRDGELFQIQHNLRLLQQVTPTPNTMGIDNSGSASLKQLKDTIDMDLS